MASSLFIPGSRLRFRFAVHHHAPVTQPHSQMVLVREPGEYAQRDDETARKDAGHDENERQHGRHRMFAAASATPAEMMLRYRAVMRAMVAGSLVADWSRSKAAL